MRVLEILSQATNVIAEGEVLQLMNTGNADLDEVAYLQVIQRKTAKLFEAAAQLGAVLGGADRRARGGARPLRNAPRHRVPAHRRRPRLLGRARASSARISARDLAEGKMTLPSRSAPAAVGSAGGCRAHPAAISSGNGADFTPVMAMLERTGALDYARRRAVQESEAACRHAGGAAAFAVQGKPARIGVLRGAARILNPYELALLTCRQEVPRTRELFVLPPRGSRE